MRKPLISGFAVLDLETTGFGKTDRILEIAIDYVQGVQISSSPLQQA
jgi:DNA polymerase III epsilon subunit-like protein